MKLVNLRSNWRTSTMRSTNSSWTIIAAKNSDLCEAHQKSLNGNRRIKEVSEFHLRHYCKTKFWRRPRHYFGTYSQEYTICKMKFIVWLIQTKFRMLNQFAMEIPTLPVDQCLSHLIQFLKECWGILLECRTAKKGRHAFGTHMVYRQTFFAHLVASYTNHFCLLEDKIQN